MDRDQAFVAKQTVPTKVLSEAERTQSAAMAIHIARTVETLLRRRPTDDELNSIAEQTWLCFATDATDQREVFLRCLLHLPDWKNDHRAIHAMLNSLQAGDDPVALMRDSLKPN